MIIINIYCCDRDIDVYASILYIMIVVYIFTFMNEININSTCLIVQAGSI